MTVLPLEWPDYLQGPSGLQRFTADVPVIGIYARGRREIERQLMARDSSCLTLWGDDPRRLQVVSVVSPIVQEYGGWPNSWFIPQDRCDILFWDTSMHSMAAEALMVIAKKFSLPPTHPALNHVMDLSYGDFIDSLSVPDRA